MREYLNQAPDAYFTIEIQPRKLSLRTNASNSVGFGQKGEMMRYRFVTKTLKKVENISDFNEKFLAQLSKANLKDYTIRFTAFDDDKYGNPTELGSTTLTFDNFRDFTQHKLILSCSLKEPIIKRGEILIGLCYLPTAERMSVNIMKVTNMNPYYSYGTISKQSICYVRVFLLRSDSGKVLKRKKTTYQKVSSSSSESEPIFNETLVFDMPPSHLSSTVLLVMVCLTDKIVSSPSSSSFIEKTNYYNNYPLPHAAKRHSTPENASPSPTLLHHRLSVDDSHLFHYGENLSRRESGSLRSKDTVVGKVPFGMSIRNKEGKIHWEKMMRAPRTIASEWHSLK